MKSLVQAVLLACLISLLHIVSAQAAPGDFILKWGALQHFSYPTAIARDPAGNIYVANISGEAKIQVFNSAGDRLRQFGSYGTGPGQFSYPNGIAVGRDGYLYVADLANNNVQIFDHNGQFLKNLGTSGSADGQFQTPEGVATDSAGNVYVVDNGNSRVQVFDSQGNFIRKWGSAGSGDGQFQFPMGIAIDGNGQVYVVDNVGANVQVFDSSGNFIRKWGSRGTGDGQFTSSVAIAVDSSGRVYVTDIGQDTVQFFTGTGTFLGKWGGDGVENGQFDSPWGIVIGLGGELYVTDENNQRVEIFNASGTFLRKWWSFGDGNGEFSQPYETAVAANGNVFVMDTANNRVQLFTDTGVFIRTWGSAGQGDGQFNYPEAIALDAAGNVYVADKFNNRVQVFDPTGKFLRKWPVGDYPSGIAIDAAGDVFVAETGDGRIDAFDEYGKLLRSWGGLGNPNMVVPYRIALDVNGNLYVTDTGQSMIDVFDNKGTFIRHIGEGTFDSTSYLHGIAVDPSGNILVPDMGRSVIWIFNPSGSVRQIWGQPGDGNGQYQEPGGISLDKTGTNVYVADTGNNRIQVLQGFTGTLPAGWSTLDVGDVGIPGRANFLNGTFTLSGSGTDIWGSSDSFRFAYLSMSGDTQIIARVVSVDNTSPWAKAGVMIRENLTAGSPYAMMDLTPGAGAEFSRRSSAGGTAVVTARSAAAPYWVKLVRSGTTFTGYVSADGSSWSQVGSSTIAMSASVLVGLAVTSHDNDVLCTARIDGASISVPDQIAPVVTAFTIPTSSSSLTVAIGSFTATDNVAVTGYLITESPDKPSLADPGWTPIAPTSYTVSATGSRTLYAWARDAAGNISASRSASVTVSSALPAPWLTQDIGEVTKTGSAGYLNGVFTLQGAGADIWGSADAFRFLFKPMTGDGQIVARVASLQNTSPWAKGGVMIRQSLTANSVHAMMDVTPGSGAEFSRRTATGGSTTVTAQSGITAPYWVKLVRSGNSFTGYVSSNGTTWVQVGSSSVAMTGTVYVGLVVTSHSSSLCTATFDGVK